MRNSLLASLLVSLLFAATAQSQQQPRAGETIDVAITNVEVVVTDRAGNPVRGLTKADFDLRENGRVQPITNFAEYAAQAGTVRADAAPAATAAPERRTIVIFIETFKTAELKSKPIFEGFRSMLREVVRPGDAVAVTMFHDSLVVVQEFTDDLTKLDDALAVVEATTAGATTDALWDVRRTDALQEQSRQLVEGKPDPLDLIKDEPPSRTYSFEYAADLPETDKLQRAKYEWFRINQTADAAAALMDSIAGVSGRKVMIMATDHFGRHAGASFFGGKVPERFFSELETKKVREKLAASANANGVSVYALYPVEVASRPRNDPMEVRVDVYTNDSDADAARSSLDQNIALNETSALKQLADHTGGRMAAGAAGIVELLPAIAEDLQSYYSLAYRTQPTGRDLQKTIDVRTKNRDHVVRVRRQIVEKSDVTKMKDRVIANLYRSNEDARLPISATIGAVAKGDDGRRSIPVSVRVPIGSLTLTPGNEGHAGTFSVYVASGGPVGATGEVQQQTQRFAIPPADLERARASHFTYDVTLEVDALSDRVTVGVRDEASGDFGLALVKLPPAGGSSG